MTDENDKLDIFWKDSIKIILPDKHYESVSTTSGWSYRPKQVVIEFLENLNLNECYPAGDPSRIWITWPETTNNRIEITFHSSVEDRARLFEWIWCSDNSLYQLFY